MDYRRPAWTIGGPHGHRRPAWAIGGIGGPHGQSAASAARMGNRRHRRPAWAIGGPHGQPAACMSIGGPHGYRRPAWAIGGPHGQPVTPFIPAVPTHPLGPMLLATYWRAISGLHGQSVARMGNWQPAWASAARMGNRWPAWAISGPHGHNGNVMGVSMVICVRPTAKGLPSGCPVAQLIGPGVPRRRL
jgi:hypothetical protein